MNIVRRNEATSHGYAGFIEAKLSNGRSVQVTASSKEALDILRAACEEREMALRKSEEA